MTARRIISDTYTDLSQKLKIRRRILFLRKKVLTNINVRHMRSSSSSSSPSSILIVAARGAQRSCMLGTVFIIVINATSLCPQPIWHVGAGRYCDEHLTAATAFSLTRLSSQPSLLLNFF
jgi:hypothetical protein